MSVLFHWKTSCLPLIGFMEHQEACDGKLAAKYWSTVHTYVTLWCWTISTELSLCSIYHCSGPVFTVNSCLSSNILTYFCKKDFSRFQVLAVVLLNIQSSGVLHHVDQWMVTDVLKHRISVLWSVFLFFSSNFTFVNI